MASPLVVYSSAADGQVRSVNASYTTARAGSSLAATTNGTSVMAGQYLEGGSYNVYEAFFDFDTSPLGALSPAVVVTAVTLNIRPAAYNAGSFTLQARAHDWGESLTTADFIPGADLSGKTLLATLATGAGLSAARHDMVSEDAFAAAIDMEGVTRLVLVSARTVTGDEPSGYEYTTPCTYESNDNDKRPRLTVEYEEAPAPAAASGSAPVPFRRRGDAWRRYWNPDGTVKG